MKSSTQKAEQVSNLTKEGTLRNEQIYNLEQEKAQMVEKVDEKSKVIS